MKDVETKLHKKEAELMREKTKTKEARIRILMVLTLDTRILEH